MADGGERVKYPQPDGRGIMKRKWSVEKASGALVLIGELMAKKLIQHGWPVEWRLLPRLRGAPERLRFDLLTGPSTPDFLAAVGRAAAIVASRFGAALVCGDAVIFLDGPHYVVTRRYFSGNKEMIVAYVRRGVPACPF